MHRISAQRAATVKAAGCAIPGTGGGRPPSRPAVVGCGASDAPSDDGHPPTVGGQSQGQGHKPGPILPSRRRVMGWPGSGLSAERRGDSVMARTYREIAIEEMLRTVEEAMSGVIDWWGDLPPPMKEAIEQFRAQLGAAIDSVEFVKRALDRQVPETDRGEGPA